MSETPPAGSPAGDVRDAGRRRLLALLGATGVAGLGVAAASVLEAPATSEAAVPGALSPAPSGRDDTAALQDWLDRGGSRLVFSAGAYRIASTLTVPSGVAVSGWGARLVRTGGDFDMVMLTGADTALVGLEVDGARTGAGTGRGILVNECVRGTVRGCHVHDVTAQGINVQGASSGYLVAENTVERCGQQAISVDHSDDGRVIGNTIDTALHGVQWWGGDSAKTSEIGIRGMVVADNRIANVMGGIWGSCGQHITVTGNRIEGCTDVGVDFEGCQDCTAVGNTVHDAAHACYSVFYGSQRIVFAGNVGLNDAAGSTGSGFKAYRSTPNQRIEVSGNHLQVVGAVAVDSDRGALAWSTIRGNTLVAGAGQAGVHLWECEEMRVTDNEVTVSGPTGIAQDGGSNGQIEGNHVLTTADTTALGASSGGVHLHWASAAKPCQRNRVRGNVVRGFVQSVFDDCGADGRSWNLVEGNVATTVVRRNAPGWTGVVDGNRHESTHAPVVPVVV